MGRHLASLQWGQGPESGSTTGDRMMCCGRPVQQPLGQPMRFPIWQRWPQASGPKDGLEVEPEGSDDSQVQATRIHLTSAEHLPCSESRTNCPPSSQRRCRVTASLSLHMCLGPGSALPGCVTLDKLLNLSVPWFLISKMGRRTVATSELSQGLNESQTLKPAPVTDV